MKAVLRPLKLMLFFLTLLTLSCSPLMATFDQASYSQVTSLKVDALALMDKSTEDYSSHVSDVNALQLELNKAIEYDKHRPNNTITNDMWNLLSDPSGHLLGGFLAKWQKDGKESAAYVTDKKQQISDSFDQIAELEIKKMKAKQ
jgi:hypothetical protein